MIKMGDRTVEWETMGELVEAKATQHGDAVFAEIAGRTVTYHELEYGSYLSQWRRRSALKMWTGWPTFPMLFVKGRLIGGAMELQGLIDSGELNSLLA